MRRLTAETAIFFFSAACAMLCSSTTAMNNCSVSRSKRMFVWITAR